MKVCYISSLYPPYYLGGEQAVQREAEGLATKNHDVFVITTSPQRKSYIEVINRVKVYRVFPFQLFPIFHFRSKPIILRFLYHIIDIWNVHSFIIINKILREETPDIVHVHNYKGLSLSVFSSIKKLGIPSTVTVNDYALACPRGTLLRANGSICHVPRKICRVYQSVQAHLCRLKPSVVTSTSEFMIKKVQEFGFFRSSKTMMMPVGVALNTKKVSKEYKHIHILYVGGISKVKGVHIAIDAFIKLIRSGQSNISLHIVGQGLDYDEMTQRAENCKDIHFYGFLSDSELDEIRLFAQIAVVPSIWYDTAQGVIYESYNYGIPVIASDIGGIPELVIDGYNGMLFEPGNVDELINKLTYLLQHKEQIQLLGKNAKSSSLSVDIEHHVDELLALYQSIKQEQGK